MKHSTTPEAPTSDAVHAALCSVGLNASNQQVSLLVSHAASVLLANETTNLTRIVEPADFIRLHIVDSLIPLLHLDLAHGNVVDVGSGAGFPGIPLAIMGCQVTLCESRKKKAAYMERWVDELRLSARVVALRAEELAAQSPVYDWVIMRAVSSLASLVEISSPLLVQGGRLAAMKGIRNQAEEVQASRACKMVGMELVSVAEYELPGGSEQRTLYVYQRTGPVRVRLPRRPGLAQSQPLG